MMLRPGLIGLFILMAGPANAATFARIAPFLTPIPNPPQFAPGVVVSTSGFERADALVLPVAASANPAARSTLIRDLTVPEPMVWAELALGFAIVGVLVRRRKPSVVAA
jgi:hypothetical protein